MTDAAGEPAPGSPPRLELAGISEQGPVRRENQDAWEVATVPPDGCLLLLADGMGGHADGGTSARAALAAALSTLLTIGDDPARALHAAFEAATAAVAQHRETIGAATGTTLVIAMVQGTTCTIGNVGDSRAYLVRGGRAEQRTEDHSFVAEEVRAGRLSEDAAEGHPHRNVLTRAITGDPVTPDVFPSFELALGDVVLLCSDGFWEMDGAGLGRFLSGPQPLLEQLAGACGAALEAGARDNVTLAACRMSRLPN